MHTWGNLCYTGTVQGQAAFRQDSGRSSTTASRQPADVLSGAAEAQRIQSSRHFQGGLSYAGIARGQAALRQDCVLHHVILHTSGCHVSRRGTLKAICLLQALAKGRLHQGRTQVEAAQPQAGRQQMCCQVVQRLQATVAATIIMTRQQGSMQMGQFAIVTCCFSC